MIIFLYGEDTYRSAQKLKEIKDKFIKEVDESGMNLVDLAGASLKFEEFNQQVKASPFLARKRMIIIKNLISDNKSKEIQKEIVKLLDEELKQEKEDNIIVFWESTDHSKSKTKNSLWQRLIKEKFAQEFAPLKPQQLQKWLLQEFKEKNINADTQAITLLAALVGNDLWQMNNEINKLLHYSKDQTITSEMVEKLVKAKYDDDIFKLVDALGNKNKKLALKLISDQLNLQANELYLLSMLIRQFKILLQIKDLQQTNPQINQSQLASTLKLHPFVTSKGINQDCKKT